MKSYLELWRRAFDYKGISTLREFWLPFGIHAAVAVVMGVLFLIGTQATTIAALVLAAFLIISAVPFAALTVRRLHDVGKSGWWYFLWFGLGIGAVVLMVILACSGGGFSVLDNNAVCVYGPPPPDFDYSTTDETSDFDPSDNVMEVVYGPPEWFGVTVETYDETDEETHEEGEIPANGSEQETSSNSPATKSPATETPVTEPPATETPVPVESETDFDTPAKTEETDGKDTVPEPEEFNPDDNLGECVYGPPEWFE